MIGLYAIALGAPRDLIGARGEPLRLFRHGELELSQVFALEERIQVRRRERHSITIDTHS